LQQDKLGEVKLHTVGQHSVNRNEIYTATYDVSAGHVLDNESVYKFEMGENLRVIGIGTRPEDSLYDVFITYMNEGDDFQVGKVLYIDLSDTSTAKMFNFMSSKSTASGKTVSQRIFDIH